MFLKIDKRILSLTIVAVLIAAGLIWLAAFWQLGKIREMSDNIQKEQLDHLVQEQRNKRILELKKELGDVGETKKDMDAFLIDKENAVPFLELLEGIARSTGNKINISVTDLAKMKSQLTPKNQVSKESDDESTDSAKKDTQKKNAANVKNEKQDFSNQLGFLVDLTGEYRSLIDFLTKLENAPYFIRVYNFQIAQAEKKQNSQTGTINESQAPPEGGQADQNEENAKNITTVLTIGVYTNGAK
jgi:HAMP domain-containing protein